MSDELSAALRELAAAQQAPPVVGGAEIRDRAIRRRRRRRTAYALGAGTASVALLAFALTLDLAGNADQRPGSRPPAVTPPATAPPSSTTPAPAPEHEPKSVPASGTLDLRKHTLTLADRTMPILSEFVSELDSKGPMKVVAKRRGERLPFDMPPDGRTMVHVSYVVELRDGAGRPHFVSLFAPQLKALSDDGGKSSWLGLGEKDAAWFYDRVRVGDAFSVTIGAPAA
ncbi:hypothetical protein [Streptomyces sp. HD]|uniref:hypothetical protein n=1 Tax=Streptomyces sp. HD TaxID=3020892 RepID=UPI00232B673A|nr:hypothetical protein [Streptomyces sp. HD]MDC0769553.1 hypothetical protein [Streptomyces sp. HD]